MEHKIDHTFFLNIGLLHWSNGDDFSEQLKNFLSQNGKALGIAISVSLENDLCVVNFEQESPLRGFTANFENVYDKIVDELESGRKKGYRPNIHTMVIGGLIESSIESDLKVWLGLCMVPVY